MVARQLEGEARAVAFIGAWAGGGALLADRPAELADPEDDPFALLDRTDSGTWAGWLGYRLGRRLERLPTDGARPVPRPTAVLARFEHVCRCDGEGRWWVESAGAPDPEVVDRWQARLAAPAPVPTWTAGPLTAHPTRADHVGSVEEAVLRISAGQLYQANVCLRLEASFSGSALGLWCEAGARLQPARAAFVADEEGAVASLSPEVFLLRHGRQARTEPIKGTRPLTPRGRAELLAAEKDRAEHVMIVDLVRNDLGRVCRPGSVHVARLLEAEPLAGVWHLVSAVEGTLTPGRGDAALVRACFPPGSVTGAPKVAAQALCSRVEPTAREAYCGAMGFASADHGLELNVAIRTFEVAGGRLWLGVGGGIVAGSDGATEWDECQEKAAPLLSAAGLQAEHEPIAPSSDRGPCFDTMLLVDAQVIERVGHLARFAEATGLDAASAVDAAAAAHPRGTWRLRVDQAGSGVTTSTVEVARPHVLDGGWAVADIVLVDHPGGYGSRKWADRRSLDRLDTWAAPAVPVLCDAGGAVLEATWANVVALIDGVVCTPPLDGRILPGVTRRALLDEAVDLGLPVRIGRLGATQLAGADAVLLTSAVRGLTWVRGIEGLGAGGLDSASGAGGLGSASGAGGLGSASGAGGLGSASGAGGLGSASGAGGLARFEGPHPLVAKLAGALSRRWRPRRSPVDRPGDPWPATTAGP